MGTGFLCAHSFVSSGVIHCFVLAAKLKFQSGVQQGETEDVDGYSRCEHDTIFCRYPGTIFQAPSVDSFLVLEKLLMYK